MLASGCMAERHVGLMLAMMTDRALSCWQVLRDMTATNSHLLCTLLSLGKRHQSRDCQLHTSATSCGAIACACPAARRVAAHVPKVASLPCHKTQKCHAEISTPCKLGGMARTRLVLQAVRTQWAAGAQLHE